ncbi:hypothetical protein ACOSQ2_031155 [Xanthoceras sorbifolium]
MSRMASRSIISGYRDGFQGIKSLVDVGGGTRVMTAEIVKSYPHIKGINFYLPHAILYNWNDESCVKILKNCREAIPEESGKVILVDIVVEPQGKGPCDALGVVLDLLMMAYTCGGKERTELEWKPILQNHQNSIYYFYY